MVVTRAQAQQNLEEELLRREKEPLAGAKPSPMEERTGEPEAQTDGIKQAVQTSPLRTRDGYVNSVLKTMNREESAGIPWRSQQQY